jgi:hypothetical protein
MDTNTNHKEILSDLFITKCPNCFNCERIWTSSLFDNSIICKCKCHKKKVLGRDESQPNRTHPSSFGDRGYV